VIEEAGVPELRWLVLVHAALTWALVGLILVIQFLHYPLFDQVGEAAFTRYQAAHMNAITLLVGPLMLAELATGLLLLGVRPAGVPAWTVAAGFVLILVVWGGTLFLSVPQHGRLLDGFDPAAYRALVDTNWVRTLAWLARGVLVLIMLDGMLRR
jgi:hypothetical protein